MQDVIDFLMNNPIYAAVAVLLVILIVVSLAKKMMKLAVIALIAFGAYGYYVYDRSSDPVQQIVDDAKSLGSGVMDSLR